MMRPPLVAATLIALTSVARGAHAQTGAIALRDLGPIITTSPITFRDQQAGFNSPDFVMLSDGRVVAFDRDRRMVLLLDAPLSTSRTIIDSTQGKPNSFNANSFIFPFRADSSFYFDGSSNTLVVTSPNGELGRVMPAPPVVPRVPGFNWNTNAPGSGAYHLIYQIRPPVIPITKTPAGVAERRVRVNDTALVLRVEHATRRIDTVGAVDYGFTRLWIATPDTVRATQVGQALFPFSDDAVVTSDGGVAIFRAREYRVDRISPDGKRVAGPRIPFAAKRVTDDDRVRILDSVSASRRLRYDSLMAKRAADSARTGAAPTMPVTSTVDDVRITRQVPVPPPAPPTRPDPDEVPDYMPPSLRHGVMADADNNVWILTTLSTPTRQAWDIIDVNGRLVDRVRTPSGARVVGFAPGGRIFLFVVSGDRGHLAVARLR